MCQIDRTEIHQNKWNCKDHTLLLNQLRACQKHDCLIMVHDSSAHLWNPSENNTLKTDHLNSVKRAKRQWSYGPSFNPHGMLPDFTRIWRQKYNTPSSSLQQLIFKHNSQDGWHRQSRSPSIPLQTFSLLNQ